MTTVIRTWIAQGGTHSYAVMLLFRSASFNLVPSSATKDSKYKHLPYSYHDFVFFAVSNIHHHAVYMHVSPYKLPHTTEHLTIYCYPSLPVPPPPFPSHPYAYWAHPRCQLRLFSLSAHPRPHTQSQRTAVSVFPLSSPLYLPPTPKGCESLADTQKHREGNCVLDVETETSLFFFFPLGCLKRGPFWDWTGTYVKAFHKVQFIQWWRTAADQYKLLHVCIWKWHANFRCIEAERTIKLFSHGNDKYFITVKSC